MILAVDSRGRADSPASPGRSARGGVFHQPAAVTSEGEEVAFFDDVLKDRIVVVNFFYTGCTDMCSLTTARLAQVYDWLGERMGRDVFFVSITLDPENDTPEKLATFKAGFNADRGWTFLTGSRENIDTIRAKLGEKARALALHRTDMVIGNAKDRRLAAIIRHGQPDHRPAIHPRT